LSHTSSPNIWNFNLKCLFCKTYWNKN
jgi:hypothetical protein